MFIYLFIIDFTLYVAKNLKKKEEIERERSKALTTMRKIAFQLYLFNNKIICMQRQCILYVLTYNDGIYDK